MTERDFQQKLQAITDGYVSSLPGTRAQIKTLGEELAGNWDTETAEDLRHACHKLAGSAATFGFPVISQHARAIEQLIQAMLEDARMPRADELQNLGNMLGELAVALQQVTRQTG